MLSLETRDAWGWSVDVTVGANTRTYTNLTTDASAYSAIAAFKTWLNASGRPWYPGTTFDWVWIRDATTGGAYLALTCSGNFTMTSGAASTLMLPAIAGSSVSTGTGPAVGTWTPKSGLAVTRYLRFLDEPGDACAAGAVRPGLQATGTYQPHVEASGTAQEAARLTWVLGQASNPRRAWLWRKDAKAWVQLALGPVERSMLDGTLYRFEFECGGPSA